MTQEVTPSEYQRINSSNNSGSGSKKYLQPGIIVVATLVLFGIGFVAGMSYQKSQTKTNTAFGQGTNGANGARGFGNRQRPNIGTVKTVSTDSITVSDTRSGSDKTYKISGTTTVTNDGASAAVSDIKTGDTVVVQVDSSDSSSATRIILNPNFQGSSQSGSSTQDSNTQ